MQKKDRYDTPSSKVALDVTNLQNFEYDMQHCIKCKGCYWVEHTYMPGTQFSTRCPSNVWNDFDSYGAFGKMRIGLKVLMFFISPDAPHRMPTRVLRRRQRRYSMPQGPSLWS